MAGAARWTLGMAASLALHAAAALAMVPFLAARPPEQSTHAAAEASISTVSVRRAEAVERAPSAQRAEGAQATATESAFAAPPQRTAAGLVVSSRPTRTERPDAVPLDTATTSGAPAPLSAPAAETITSQSVGGREAGERQALATRARVDIPAPERLAPSPSAVAAARQAPGVAPQIMAAAVVAPPADISLLADAAPETAAAREAAARPQGTAPLPVAALSSQPPPVPVPNTPAGAPAPRQNEAPAAALAAMPAPLAAGNGAEAPALPPDAGAAPLLSPQPQPAPALLAWSGDLSVEVPEATVDLASALRLAAPEADGPTVRDRIAEGLGIVSCARAQTFYDPETGRIELRGHVPGEAERDRIMAAVAAEIGGAIPVVDRLRRLGPPQCGVLGQLARLDIPQSVEQFTNPLIIGDDLHTRVYSFRGGETMRFELTGADYDGWLYLDYYDANGQVLHLVPNAVIAPVLLAAEAPLSFGGGGPEDIAAGRLELRVSPPYGEDIAVALVASRQLFDAPRPTVEPAAGYLADLERRISMLSSTDPTFRGEWVYLFVETTPE